MEGGKIEGNKKKDNKIVVSTGRGGASLNGGGFGGIVVLGGVLAFAALVSFYANKKIKNRPTNKDQSTDSDSSENLNLKNTDDDASEGLQLLVQPESSPIVHLNPCCKRNGKSEIGSRQIDVDEIINQNSILEEIRVLEINGGKETQQNGDHYESMLSHLINLGGISLSTVQDIENENHKLQLIQISSVVEEEPEPIQVIDEEKQEEEAEPIELIDERKQEEDSQKAFTEHVEPYPSMNSVEEEEQEEYSQEEGDDDDKDEQEKSKESSEETVDSSMESNDDLIWPTEAPENLSTALKDHQGLGEKVGEDGGTVETENGNEEGESVYDHGNGESEMISNTEKKTKTVNANHQLLRRLRMIILGMVMLLVILSLITHHQALFSLSCW